MKYSNDDFLSYGIEELKSRVNNPDMDTVELALAIIAIRLDELALDYNTDIGSEDPYGRNRE